jgi:hypothetical protein
MDHLTFRLKPADGEATLSPGQVEKLRGLDNLLRADLLKDVKDIVDHLYEEAVSEFLGEMSEIRKAAQIKRGLERAPEGNA